jgi:hypothetical protein
MSTTVTPNTRMALSLAVGLYLVWALATYLLEGRIHTLLRPEAMGARLSYALVANILIGIGGSALVIRFMSRAGVVSTERAGFRGLRHAAIAVVVRVVLGFAFYALQGLGVQHACTGLGVSRQATLRRSRRAWLILSQAPSIRNVLKFCEIRIAPIRHL